MKRIKRRESLVEAGSSAPPGRAIPSNAGDAATRRVEPLTPKRPSTKALLMDAAEQLVSRRGVEGVTLREIAVLAGQANSNVVQYHFKDKQGLVEAILDDRMRRRERMRHERLDALKAQGRQKDLRELLAILWLPTLIFRDEDGDYVFCRFLLQCWLQPDILNHHPVAERYEGSTLVEIVQLLRAGCKDVAPDVFDRRLAALSLMFISCVVEFNNTGEHRRRNAEFDAAPLLDMSVVALSAP
jgi:AcrR family transcriptional regulator